jgi:hypothetical protein
LNGYACGYPTSPQNEFVLLDKLWYCVPATVGDCMITSRFAVVLDACVALLAADADHVPRTSPVVLVAVATVEPNT